MKLRSGILILLVSAIFPAATLAENESYTIRAQVTGAQPEQGQILASLYNSKKTYMRQPLSSLVIEVNSNGEAELDFGRYPSGKYAITVVYDQNSNGKLDTGMFRIPKEKIGYSNNAKGRFGPAKWKHTWFALQKSDVLLDIAVKSIKKEKR